MSKKLIITESQKNRLTETLINNITQNPNRKIDGQDIAQIAEITSIRNIDLIKMERYVGAMSARWQTRKL